jgi:hypothetical protein
VLSAADIHNLTLTDSADEGPPVSSGAFVAFDVRQAGLSVGIRSLDLRGEPSLEGHWSLLARLQNALTNLQQVGQTAGVANVFWSLEPPAKAAVAFSPDGMLEVRLDSRTVRLSPAGGESPEALTSLQLHRAPKAHPGNLVTWAVDRVRAFSWFGDERMQWLKAVTFAALDVAQRVRARLGSDDTARDVAADLGDLATATPPSSYTDPESGWPPAPMKPLIAKALEGEGQWIPLDKDPFVATNPGAPAAFVTSYLRADPMRAYTRVYVTLWDPRQIETHMMAGSIEPRGPAGEAGPGLVPRTPERMKRFVGALNGGFQALHGEFGMMVDGVEYLPPKPFAATVAEMSDGSTGFGTWPRETDIPANVLSFRQNLTALVQDGKFNPFGRTWWGGTPPDWEDRVHSTRTGICLTEEGFVGYFYGNEIDYVPLSRAMIQARCKYGIHLDMNPGHTGLEFYRLAPAGKLPPLDRPMQKDWEAEGAVELMDGWTFRARRMIRYMGLMNFPRYIQREARDFFYLTLRPVLPGEDLAPVVAEPEPDEGKWRTKGLPQHGFPPAVATTFFRPDPARPTARLLLLKIDPKTVRPASVPGDPASPPSEPILSFASAHVVPGRPTLWFTGGPFSIQPASPSAGSVAVVSGSLRTELDAAKAVAALGVQDEDGMLVYAEVLADRRPGPDALLLLGVLEKLGCSSALLLSAPLLPAFGEQARHARAGGADPLFTFVRARAPGARSIFESTPIVGPKEWFPLQARRVRYFRKPTVASPRASSVAPAEPSQPSEQGTAP